MPGTHTFRLKFHPATDEPIADIEFEAVDAFSALGYAHDKARHYNAELWQDGERLCNIRRVDGEVWQVSGSRL